MRTAAVAEKLLFYIYAGRLRENIINMITRYLRFIVKYLSLFPDPSHCGPASLPLFTISRVFYFSQALMRPCCRQLIKTDADLSNKCEAKLFR